MKILKKIIASWERRLEGLRARFRANRRVPWWWLFPRRGGRKGQYWIWARGRRRRGNLSRIEKNSSTKINDVLTEKNELFRELKKIELFWNLRSFLLFWLLSFSSRNDCLSLTIRLEDRHSTEERRHVAHQRLPLGLFRRGEVSGWIQFLDEVGHLLESLVHDSIHKTRATWSLALFSKTWYSQEW